MTRQTSADAVELAIFQSAMHSIAEEMGAADKRSIEAGVPVAKMMEAAGGAVARFVLRRFACDGLVVVLGRTGRNFAAGMTGGIAFVLDRTGGEFANILCNRRDVDLGPVVDPKDIEMLLSLLTRHGEYTGSPQTKWILDNWEAALPQFVKVFPQEYKRVLGLPKASAGVLASRAAATPRWGRAGD